eukprot:1906639-Rhodomonas_salina.1
MNYGYCEEPISANFGSQRRKQVFRSFSCRPMRLHFPHKLGIPTRVSPAGGRNSQEFRPGAGTDHATSRATPRPHPKTKTKHPGSRENNFSNAGRNPRSTAFFRQCWVPRVQGTVELGKVQVAEVPASEVPVLAEVPSWQEFRFLWEHLPGGRYLPELLLSSTVPWYPGTLVPPGYPRILRVPKYKGSHCGTRGPFKLCKHCAYVDVTRVPGYPGTHTGCCGQVPAVKGSRTNCTDVGQRMDRGNRLECVPGL